MLENIQMENRLVEQNLKVLVENDLIMSQQCVLVAKRVNGILGHLRRSIYSANHALTWEWKQQILFSVHLHVSNTDKIITEFQRI